MRENEDQRKFFKDVGATAEQAVEERLEENYQALIVCQIKQHPAYANFSD